MPGTGRPVRRAAGRPRPHRRLRHATCRARPHQLASGFESLFNACLLRRPPREYRKGHFGGATLAWADEAPRRSPARCAAHHEPPLLRPRPGRRHGLPLRGRADERGKSIVVRRSINSASQDSRSANIARRNTRAASAPGTISAPRPDAARHALSRSGRRRGARRRCSSSSAWPRIWSRSCRSTGSSFTRSAASNGPGSPRRSSPSSAPGSIVQRAQLDIGFVRAQTEIGMLEQQPDHPRAHLSRYTALYTSLSTTYDLEFGNLTTLAAPFPTQGRLSTDPRPGTVTNVDFQRYDNVRLAGLPISSNSTGMVHSEQMFPLDGADPTRQVDGPRRTTRSKTARKFELHSVVRRAQADAETNERSWASSWTAGGSASCCPANRSRVTASLPLQSRPMNAPVCRRARGRGPTRRPAQRLQPRADVPTGARSQAHRRRRNAACRPRRRSAARAKRSRPAASQVRGATLVVAHLDYARATRPAERTSTPARHQSRRRRTRANAANSKLE